MTWLYLTLTSAFFISAANLFRRVLMKDKDTDPFSAAIIFQLFVAALTFIIAFAVGFVPPPLSTLPWHFLLSTVLWTITTWAFFSALKTVEVSQMTIFWAFGSIIAIIAGVLFLNEPFTLLNTVGTALILLAIFIAQNKHTSTNKSGFQYAILATSAAALAVVNDTYIIQHYHAISYAAVMFLLPGIVLLVLKPQAVRSFSQLKQKTYLRNMTLIGLFYSIQSVAFYTAVEVGGNISQISPVSKIEIIFTVLLGIIFLRERTRLVPKLLAASLATVGVLLLR